jgi:hypothetical protein
MLLIWFIFFPSDSLWKQASETFNQTGLFAVLHLSACAEISITDREAIFCVLPKFNFFQIFS